MIEKRSYKKCKSHNISSRRKINKKYQLGGSGEIPNLTEIDSLITNINIAVPDESLIELEKHANIMTIQQTYEILMRFGNTNLEELQKLSVEYNTLLQIIKERFTKYPKIVKNIEILMNDLSNEYGIYIESLNRQYDTFPISKINPKLGQITNSNKGKIITYDKHTYKLMGEGSFSSVFINVEQGEAIKKSNSNPEYSFKSEVIHYNNISSLVCNTNYFCKFKNCFIGNYGKIYILMEYCGISLTDILKNTETLHKLPFETLIQWFITIAKGIKCMHDNGYVHLDIKPLNITIDNNEAKLIDFGCAQYIPDIKTQLLVGTPTFMAPEMEYNDIIQDYKKCDIYSLGVTFAKCIFIRYMSLFKKVENEDNEDNEDNKILSFIELASMLAIEPNDRPTIEGVIVKLTESLNTFFLNIKAAKFTVVELKAVGFSVEELRKAGFELKDIFKAGYTYGEIQSIYKYNTKQYKVLGELLKHCDKNWNFLKRHTSKECTIDTICLSNPQLNDCLDHPIKANIRRSSRSRSSGKSRSRNRSSKSTGFVVDV
jgi:serine/threonine protein kinase